MLKKELVIFTTKRCKHGRPYTEHPRCFAHEHGKLPKIGYLDIETTGFEANYHYMLSYVIKTRSKREYQKGLITRQEILSYDFDKRLSEDLLRDMLKYDVLITYYGTKFDMPFMRSRMLLNNVKFPKFGCLYHKDVYYMVRRLLKLHRNSLETAAKFFGVNDKNHVEGPIWMRARVGDKRALKYVLKHNKIDCEVLEFVHKKLEEYDKGIVRST